MNKNINKEVEKIFSVFNYNYFENKLPLQTFSFDNVIGHTICDSNVVLKDNIYYSHIIRIPEKILNQPIEYLAMFVYDGMVREYAFINNIKIFSRKGMYANRRLIPILKKCDLNYIDTKVVRGIVPCLSEGFKKICKENGFKKTWGKIYYALGEKKKGNNYLMICPGCGTKLRYTTQIMPNIICGDCRINFIEG